jgi:hypothetical protein
MRGRFSAMIVILRYLCILHARQVNTRRPRIRLGILSPDATIFIRRLFHDMALSCQQHGKVYTPANIPPLRSCATCG